MAEAADMSEADIRAAMAAAMDGGGTGAVRSRARHPGLGALLPLEQPPSGAGVGIWDGAGGSIVGEGYELQAEIAEAVHKAYGEAAAGVRRCLRSPGIPAPLGVSQPALRHVTDLGADAAVHRGRQRTGGGSVHGGVPAARPGLLARLRGLLRRGQ